MGSKIFSKICTTEDLLKELQKIEIINLKQDYSECIYKIQLSKGIRKINEFSIEFNVSGRNWEKIKFT